MIYATTSSYIQWIVERVSIAGIKGMKELRAWRREELHTSSPLCADSSAHCYLQKQFAKKKPLCWDGIWLITCVVFSATTPPPHRSKTKQFTQLGRIHLWLVVDNSERGVRQTGRVYQRKFTKQRKKQFKRKWQKKRKKEKTLMIFKKQNMYNIHCKLSAVDKMRKLHRNHCKSPLINSVQP